MRVALLNLRMAFGSLLVHPVRSVLTLIGIVIGIVALVVMMSLTEALRTSIGDAMRPLGTGVFQVQREPRFIRSSRADREAAKRKPFTEDDVAQLEQRLRRVKNIAGEMWSWGSKVKTGERETLPVCGIVGAMPPFLEANGIELAQGRFLTQYDLAFERSVAVIGSDVLKVLFPGGAMTAIGSTIRVKGRPFEVVGIMAERPVLFGAAWQNAMVAVPITTFHRAFGFRSLHVTFTAIDASEMERAKEEAIVAIRSMRGLKPGMPDDFELFSNESVGEYVDTFALILSAAAGGICFLALLVGGIGVMNIMLVSVTERTREIGIRKALGARPATILGQFIAEAVALAALGGILGVVLASATIATAAQLLDLPAVIPIWAVVLALLSSSVTGLLAGILPAARAARLDPIVALRYE